MAHQSLTCLNYVETAVLRYQIENYCHILDWCSYPKRLSLDAIEIFTSAENSGAVFKKHSSNYIKSKSHKT